jgi:hypothetical protein
LLGLVNGILYFVVLLPLIVGFVLIYLGLPASYRILMLLQVVNVIVCGLLYCSYFFDDSMRLSSNYLHQHTMSNIKCAVPFLAAFSNNNGGFRNCCSAYPATHSKPGESFEQWWTGDQMIQFRQQIQGDELPAVCNRCVIQEKVQGF